jgi:hypothetical protein
MGDIITLDQKLKRNEEKKIQRERKRKIQAVRKVFNCTHCISKCEKCGTQLGSSSSPAQGGRHVPYRFCDHCREEYIDYVERLQGGGNRTDYWQNHAWMRMWRAWIDYQGTIDEYLKTKEFEQLLAELRSDHKPHN